MLDKIIIYSFYLLFSLTPLFWTSFNFELFEFNKMFLTYGFTIVIVGTWILKIINHKSLIINRTPLDIPLLLFLGAIILSTIFSIDKHASIWGYYSRQNGGLLSLISYIFLYFAFVSNFPKEKITTLFKFALASGLIISIWGIMEHFGASPSCLILRGHLGVDCWVQDVQARVFATLGQPNWMAGYLAMLIFPALYFFLTATTKKSLYTLYFILNTLYLAFTFTYSRGPTLGLIGGFIIFIAFYFLRNTQKNSVNQKIRVSDIQKIRPSEFLISPVFRVILSFLIINLLFGSALTSFRLVSKFSPPPRPAISLPAAGGGTQLETGGTESGQIRLIVWKGALEIFKNNPLLGTGPETFAYSYYKYRPSEHNLTSEWDFLYNKAHNEYLNYLATTGIVGFGTYSIIIITFIIFILKKQNANNLLLISLLAAYISYLIYNFFLFSVVILAIFFFLFPAICFVATGSIRVVSFQSSVFRLIHSRSIYPKLTKFIVIFVSCILLLVTIKLWSADIIFSKAERALEKGSVGNAHNLLLLATFLNPYEPFYKSELAYAGASSAVALNEEDKESATELKEKSANLMEKVLKDHRRNISYYRNAVRTYFELASLDGKYAQKALDAINYAIQLAPTDPKLYLNQSLILEFLGQKEDSLKALQKAYELKPDYPEVLEKIGSLKH